MNEVKSFIISKHLVLQAYKKVKANKGAGGIDGIDFKTYEEKLKDNLYKLWNRMSSGSYFPKAVKGVEIPKKNGSKRLLGIPTIEDRIAQMVVRLTFESKVEQIFHKDSYGYRPKRSALDAIEVTRKRCWENPWLIEYDIVGLFDNIDHEKMMKAVKKHTKNKWVILYIERFLKAPIMMPDEEIRKRTSGTPQGGVISPILANLFLHYALDMWMKRQYPMNVWVRYADDGIIHCRSELEAKQILESLKERLKECGLEIHPKKTKIVYCRSDRFNKRYENESFEFLGYEFRTRYVKNRYGNFFNTFSPAVSKGAAKAFREKISKVRKANKMAPIEIMAKEMNPIIRGWMNYFMKFGKREAIKQIDYVNKTLFWWMKRKYKRLNRSKRKTWRFLASSARSNPGLFYHWKKGIRPTIV